MLLRLRLIPGPFRANLLPLMALNVMSTPDMSTEVERAFSSTKRTLSDARNRMEDDIIEYVEC